MVVACSAPRVCVCVLSPSLSVLTLLVTRRTVLGGHAEWILLSTAAAVRESKLYKLYAGATSQKPKQA